MKEKVDMLLNGEAVDIAGDGADYYLSVLQHYDKYKIGFVNPKNVMNNYQRLDTKKMKEAGNLLIALADELESRKKFRENDRYYYVRIDGNIIEEMFSKKSSFDLTQILIGNAFKTKSEAEAHKDEIMAKYQDLRDRGLV